jgi:hypothetical protein
MKNINASLSLIPMNQGILAISKKLNIITVLYILTGYDNEATNTETTSNI